MRDCEYQDYPISSTLVVVHGVKKGRPGGTRAQAHVSTYTVSEETYYKIVAVIFSQVATQLRRVLELRLRRTEIEYCSNI